MAGFTRPAGYEPVGAAHGRDALVFVLLLPFALPSISPLVDAVPESRQEAERRCCGEERLAWMPNEERWARDGPP
jgi:hypothetical protein